MRARSWILAVGLLAVVGAVSLGLPAAEPETDQEKHVNPSDDTGHGSDGRSPNRLAGSSSPYLLLHQYNPVDWYPWGEEAFAKARAENKPIFLSVGYATCYWCHVMERESFSDEAIAAVMNERFVNIKVDREQRPDLDEIYMAATQILTEHGGWPNSVFLTPDLKPFFAGTYFPPEDRHGRPGFPRILDGLADAWEGRRDVVEKQADQLADAIGRYLERRFVPLAAPPSGIVAEQAATALAHRYDPEWGGFGGAPKFPTPSNLWLLLSRWEHEESRGMLLGTLDQMLRGGIYDQVGGGFHRYATDREWKIPHFEKMLYDNGLLMEVYGRAYELGGDPEHARAVRETAAFLEREMTSPEGAFWSAIDAETDGHEGAYYVWTREELDAALGEAMTERLAPVLGFGGAPFFEGSHYVLHLPDPLAEVASARETTLESLLGELDPVRATLLAARFERERPLTDDKILADWNGLTIAGLATAGRVVDSGEMIAAASRAAAFVLEELRLADGTLAHVWRAGTAEIPAFLADYASMVHGLLALHRATGAERWLEAAVDLTDEQNRRLGDPVGGWFVAADAPDVLFRSKDIYDGALPAANSMAVLNALALHEATGDERWEEVATRALRAFGASVQAQPSASNTLAVAAARLGVEGDATAVPGGPLDDLARGVVRARLDLSDTGDDGWREVVVVLEIADGWHLNANPASVPELIPTAIQAVEGELADVEYPDGRSVRLFAEESLSVWDGAVTISARLRSDREPPAVRLTYQPCDDHRCLPPVTVEIVGVSD